MANFYITSNVITYFKQRGEKYDTKNNFKKGMFFKDIYSEHYKDYTKGDMRNLYMVFYLLCFKDTNSFNHFKRAKIAKEYVQAIEDTPSNKKYNKILSLIKTLAI